MFYINNILYYVVLSLVCQIQPELKPRGHVTIPNPPSLLRMGIEHGKFFRTNQPKPGTPPPAPAALSSVVPLQGLTSQLAPRLRIGGIWVQKTERERERSKLCASSHKEKMKTFANSPQ